MRYPLVDGQGNFGSGRRPAGGDEVHGSAPDADGDRDAQGHKPDTVDFVPNFDESQRQPEACPRGSRTCSSTAPTASQSGWRPRSRRTTSARSWTRPWRSSTTPTSTTRTSPGIKAGLPDGRCHRRSARHQGRHRDRARLHRVQAKGAYRADKGQPDPDRGNRDPLPGQQELPPAEDSRAGQGAALTDISDLRDESDRNGCA